MTIREVISRVKAMKNPCPPDEDLIKIISRTEAEILRKIVFPRAETIEFNGYTTGDTDTGLQAPAPFDELYVYGCIRYCEELENRTQEINNAERQYKEILSEYAAWYARTHRRERGHVGSPWWGM